MNEHEIADYLLAEPEFFVRHAELLSTVKLTSPYGNRVISLQERQLEMLREKNKQLERRLADVMRHGYENDSIMTRLSQWAARILSEPNPAMLPQIMNESVQTLFDVPAVAMRLWSPVKPDVELGCLRETDAAVHQFTDLLRLPYCGPCAPEEKTAPHIENFAHVVAEALQWLPTPSANILTRVGGEEAGSVTPSEPAPAFASVVLIALRMPTSMTAKNTAAELKADPLSTEQPPAVGLWVMASPDPRRFHTGMSTDFLEQLAVLASAALGRLLKH